MYRPSDTNQFSQMQNFKNIQEIRQAYTNFSQRPTNFGMPMKFKGAPNSGQSLGQNIPDVNWSNMVLPPVQKNFYQPQTVLNDEESENYRKQNEIINKSEHPLPPPMNNFETTGFSSGIIDNSLLRSFKSPTPIQAQCWPIILKGNDLIGIAQTGSGKTLAYLIPAAIHLKGQSEYQLPKILVCVPTRELAMQIQQECQKFSGKNIKCVAIYGGVDKYNQKQDLRNGCDILIATPGRLIDFMESQILNLKSITMLILDEADRMLDMGFGIQIRKIISQCRPDRQTLMFSATWPKDIISLSKEHLKDAFHVQIGAMDYSKNQNIQQIVELIPEKHKKNRLLEILANIKSKTLIFMKTKTDCQLMFQELSKIYSCQCIHGDKSQKDRDQALDDFKKQKCAILIATDVAARGLDVKDIKIVINYDFPMTIQDYVHRIGRTGRADQMGLAYTFLSELNECFFQKLMQNLEDSSQNVIKELKEIVEEQIICRMDKKVSLKLGKALMALNDLLHLTLNMLISAFGALFQYNLIYKEKYVQDPNQIYDIFMKYKNLNLQEIQRVSQLFGPSQIDFCLPQKDYRQDVYKKDIQQYQSERKTYSSAYPTQDNYRREYKHYDEKKYDSRNNSRYDDRQKNYSKQDDRQKKDYRQEDKYDHRNRDFRKSRSRERTYNKYSTEPKKSMSNFSEQQPQSKQDQSQVFRGYSKLESKVNEQGYNPEYERPAIQMSQNQKLQMPNMNLGNLNINLGPPALYQPEFAQQDQFQLFQMQQIQQQAGQNQITSYPVYDS